MDPTRNQPPVALRIVRPHKTEDALLAAEANAFTRTGVVLLGAPSRPTGVVLRFEMTLADGTPCMRGEGRVVGFRPAGEGEESALMLRFTRLDVKSKSLLDRAVAIREERRSLMPPAPRPATPSAASSPPPHKPSAPPESAPLTRPESEPEHAPVVPPPPAVEVIAKPVEQVVQHAEPEAMEVDDADLKSADESDLTEQAPPVAMLEAMGPKEKMPVPQPSPGKVPAPHPEPREHHPPPRVPPEHAPPPRVPPEHLPVPQPSREPKRRAEILTRALERKSDEFRPSLAPEERDSALERLRSRRSNA